MKTKATEIFGKATFELHKWNSNAPELELTTSPGNEQELSFAKQQLGINMGECTLLGLKWDKQRDTIAVSFPKEADTPSTKRNVLSKIARVYDPLGMVAPLLLQGKLLYREVCEGKFGWDVSLPVGLAKRWNKWESSLPKQVEVPRSLVRAREPIKSIALHGFGDASGHGLCAAVYAIVNQQSTVNQGLVVARARLAKSGLTIPRLGLVAAHMVVNLLANVEDALIGFPVESRHAWTDSSVVLHWIRGAGEFKQFVGNRVRKIREHVTVTWRHVPTHENPADLGSRGGSVKDNQTWWNGPAWLRDPTQWPPDIVTSATPESSAEIKATKEIFALAVDGQDELDGLLEKSTLWRTLRVGAWIKRFLCNARAQEDQRHEGPLTTEEINKQKIFWQSRIQRCLESSSAFDEERARFNLHPDENGVLRCYGRIQDHYPVYIPDSSIYAKKLVQHAHVATLHGGVGVTMAKVREEHWVPRLRRLSKRVIKDCAGCKRFQAQSIASPPPGRLPKDRTEGTFPFEVIGVDYTGPLTYKISTKKEGKAYVLLYSCSLTKAVHLDLLPTLETQDFIRSFKGFIARRGRPRKVYSDNGRTFVGAANWLRLVMREEKWNDFLAHNGITWQFNLSRAPWWGGQFERLVGLVKRSLHKSIGRGLLSWHELQEVLLDVEVSLNSRPLSYVEEDEQRPILTPNSLLYPKSNAIPELKPHQEEDGELRKRARYLEKCKQAMWSRWTKEYIRGLRERHNLKHGKKPAIAEGDVVIIQGEEKNRNLWKLGVVSELIVGRDGIVRAAKLRAGKGVLERAVQHLYPLELSCDMPRTDPPTLNPEAPTFRPRRDAAVAGRLRVTEILSEEQ